MKLITFGILLYFFYRFFLKPSLLGPGEEPNQITYQEEDDGEFVEYEEVD